jgi:polyribonucleotide nucleotidyltransferase
MMKRMERQIAGRTLSLEIGRMAKLAQGSCLVQYGDTVVLCAVTVRDQPTHLPFFPLTIEYREKSYAAGKIPGGFFKREGRPGEKEILSARQIDRPIRPLFPNGFMHETQVACFILSADQENDADVLALLGASVALNMSKVPFNTPVASVRVGRIQGTWVVNPTFQQLEYSDVDLVVAGSADAITMVEGGALEVSEAEILEGLTVAQEAVKELCAMQVEFLEGHTVPDMEWSPIEPDADLKAKVEGLASVKVAEALSIGDKQERSQAMATVTEDVNATLTAEDEQYAEHAKAIGEILRGIEKQTMRRNILDKGERADGRGLDDIRPITSEVGKSFMLHYNFPPFSVGEARPFRGTSRREIGHGNLAERAIQPLLPEYDDFPYTIRIVSDVLESNGSSSMATVCGTSLSLMDAGVPIKAPCAGVAMGLIKEGDDVAILTDILGLEDALGDMDFKIAGTRDGVTSIQMDIKIEGLTVDILTEALTRANKGRMHILDQMAQALDTHRSELSDWAPRIVSIQINPEKIGEIIGPKGKTIRAIQEESGAQIDIDDSGIGKIAAVDGEAGARAVRSSRSCRGPRVSATSPSSRTHVRRTRRTWSRRVRSCGSSSCPSMRRGVCASPGRRRSPRTRRPRAALTTLGMIRLERAPRAEARGVRSKAQTGPERDYGSRVGGARAQACAPLDIRAPGRGCRRGLHATDASREWSACAQRAHPGDAVCGDRRMDPTGRCPRNG